MSEKIEAAEFVRHVDVADLEPGVREKLSVEASTDECGAIAKRLDVHSVASFIAEIYVLRELSGDVSIFGDITGVVEQACVVTLEPVHEEVEASIMQRYTDRDDDEEAEEEDPVERLLGDEIEVGEVLLQNLALALDPYPRAPGVVFVAGDGGDEEPCGPFAALANLREAGYKTEK